MESCKNVTDMIWIAVNSIAMLVIQKAQALLNAAKVSGTLLIRVLYNVSLLPY